ncbi:MAG: hypothetical protein D6785_09285 [Planctomycetota bacterium]|nr:MAG: hypothetical protein D6785_09285 [Planctomycetota bacterium]
MKKEKVFTKWQGKPLEEVLEITRELVEDPNFPTAKSWKEQGGKILGHFQVYFPEEIAHAGGMLPLKMAGAQVDGTEGQLHFGSYLCSIIKSSLEVALTGKVELDMFVSHPICDAARNLAAVWARNFDYNCQILYLPQNPNSRHSVTYLTQEYERLKRDIEEIVERKITNSDLFHSFEVYNENRKWIQELYRMKRETPWLISAEDAYSLLYVGGLLPKEEHNELLAYVIPKIKERNIKKHDKMRVVFEGAFCEQPPLDLIQIIGQSCFIVDDDFMIGLRWIVDPLPLEGNPLEQLAKGYIESPSYSPVQHDLRKPKEKMLLEKFRNAQAEAVILGAAKMCEPGLEEQVTYSKTLEAEGIPYFVTEFEENQTSFDTLSIQLETFVENLLFA